MEDQADALLCEICGQWKRDCEFYRNTTSECKACAKLWVKIWRKAEKQGDKPALKEWKKDASYEEIGNLTERFKNTFSARLFLKKG